MKTRKARIQRTLTTLGDWCRRHRHLPLKEQHAALSRRLRGHYRYFGVNGNARSLRQVLHQHRTVVVEVAPTPEPTRGSPDLEAVQRLSQGASASTTPDLCSDLGQGFVRLLNGRAEWWKSPCSDLRGPGRATARATRPSRRIACDCALVRISHAPDGSILDVGRRTRTISPALRRALEARDQGCRFPGCGLRFTEAHHVTHWADGGETSLGNTLLTCRFHHRLLHEGGWKVDWWGPGRPVFFDPRGGTHFDGRWTPPEVGKRPVAALVEQNHLRGARPDAWTAGTRWKREADIPDPVYFRALEALGEAGR